jgi:hypothetical protein
LRAGSTIAVPERFTMRRIICVVSTCLILGLSAAAEDSADLKSYSTSWNTGDEAHRAIMFPHEQDGCKLLVQSKRFKRDGREAFTETEGRDCNCDLVIDGLEAVFVPATGYASRRLLEVCKGPSVDGAERRFVIMRESLKISPRYSKIPNVRSE